MEYQFKDFFISYAMAYNKKNNRIGALFINPFRRIKVNNDSHFTQLVIYIHANVVKHKLQKKFQQYIWSSYQSFLINKPTLLIKEEVLDWFGGKEKFIELHQSLVAYYYEHAMSIE
ncbi:MAG: hypothetical protein IPJ81_15205 [Chitinophagaceae bacterium]|nr:hypothetical protein [Chitinophagaceae bacterium]